MSTLIPEAPIAKVQNYKGDAPFFADCLDHGYVALRNIAGPNPST